jgi:hypothetical protein
MYAQAFAGLHDSVAGSGRKGKLDRRQMLSCPENTLMIRHDANLSQNLAASRCARDYRPRHLAFQLTVSLYLAAVGWDMQWARAGCAQLRLPTWLGISSLTP